MAEHLGLPGQDQEGSGATCYVLCVQVGGGVPLQRAAASKEEVDGKTASL